MESLSLRKTLVELAYDRILGAICDGKLKPGERVRQDEIAARLNVSRQPITSALAMLKNQGFLCDAGRRGLAVAPIDPKFFDAIYQFRSAVEPLAVRLATSRLDAGALAKGQALIGRGKAATAANDRSGLVQADMDFHSFIYDLSGNPLIAETMRLNWQHLRRAMGEVLRQPAYPSKVWREHEAILAAMISQDAQKGAELMREHIELAQRRVGPALRARDRDVRTQDVV